MAFIFSIFFLSRLGKSLFWGYNNLIIYFHPFSSTPLKFGSWQKSCSRHLGLLGFEEGCSSDAKVNSDPRDDLNWAYRSVFAPTLSLFYAYAFRFQPCLQCGLHLGPVRRSRRPYGDRKYRIGSVKPRWNLALSVKNKNWTYIQKLKGNDLKLKLADLLNVWLIMFFIFDFRKNLKIYLLI